MEKIQCGLIIFPILQLKAGSCRTDGSKLKETSNNFKNNYYGNEEMGMPRMWLRL